MGKITFRERRLIEETIKAFLNQQWCITPQAIWGFLGIHEEPVDFEKIEYILQEQQAEGSDNTFYCGKCGALPISQYPHDCPVKQGEGK